MPEIGTSGEGFENVHWVDRSAGAVAKGYFGRVCFTYLLPFVSLVMRYAGLDTDFLYRCQYLWFRMDKRLLHPGAETHDLVEFYICAIKHLRILDPSGVMLDQAARAINQYLR